MRRVVGRAGGGVENLHAELRAQLRELKRLREVNLRRVALAHAEAVAVRQAVRVLLRDAGAELAGHGQCRVRAMRHLVKAAQAHAELDGIPTRADARDDVAQDARAVLEAAAELAGPRVRAEELVQQIAVAMLQVHEVRAHVPRELRRADEVLDEPLNLVVGEDLRVARDLELRVENRMPERDTRLVGRLPVRFAETSRVCELESDDEVVRRAVTLRVRVLQEADQLSDARLVLLDEDELVRVRAAVGPHGHRLRAANQLRAALAEALPAPTHFVAQATGRRAVPALHRVERDAVADGLAVDGDVRHRLGERGIPGGNGVFTRQLNAQASAVRAKVSDRLQ